ncbi:hypothetical protein QBC36DRAFT_50061 [Triangularia setosa]|uniref:Uncharacterized protein n=1 Tax=Triangularia setosa TaxID=2587417 RepID=A0AAN6WGI6_9PEZI|nr:hypothetical protein QBC36DRAFT_50061 [Podospora setosa]
MNSNRGHRPSTLVMLYILYCLAAYSRNFAMAGWLMDQRWPPPRSYNYIRAESRSHHPSETDTAQQRNWFLARPPPPPPPSQFVLLALCMVSKDHIRDKNICTHHTTVTSPDKGAGARARRSVCQPAWASAMRGDMEAVHSQELCEHPVGP